MTESTKLYFFFHIKRLLSTSIVLPSISTKLWETPIGSCPLNPFQAIFLILMWLLRRNENLREKVRNCKKFKRISRISVLNIV
jgi:hypothetical protein